MESLHKSSPIKIIAPIKKTNSIEVNLHLIDPFNKSPPNNFVNNLEKRYLQYYNNKSLNCTMKYDTM